MPLLNALLHALPHENAVMTIEAYPKTAQNAINRHKERGKLPIKFSWIS